MLRHFNMSYDYNGLVSQITSSRRLAAEGGEEKINHLQQAVDSFSDLSAKCPMTPLLWMQYSADTAELLEELTQDSAGAMETRLQILELALAEFPGSAILHVHYLQLLSNEDKIPVEKIRKALETAIDNVGRGSHRNEGELISAIYSLDANFRAKFDLDDGMKSFHERALIPMKGVNDGLNNEFEQFCRDHGTTPSPEDLQKIEQGRRLESRVYGALVTCEDEVDMAMHNERTLPRHQVNLTELHWDTILLSDEKTFWMGLGGMGSANAFLQYAKTCYRYRHRNDDDDDTEDIERNIKSLALSVYERGVAECPTVETLWLSYIRHLTFLTQTDNTFLPRLQSVVDRSVRNCPYSLPLYQQKIQIHLLMADLGKAIVDPDDLQRVVQEALDAKFITSPQSCLELHMTAIQVVKRRILSLLASAKTEQLEKEKLAYDDAEPLKSSISSVDIDDASRQEVDDLCDDIRDMYDSVDTYLRKNHSKWPEGRAYLWSERSFTESHLLGQLADSLGDEVATASTKRLAELIRCHDKLTKVFQPAHPDSFASYISGVLDTFPTTTAYSVLSKLRQTRWLYQKALRSVGKPKHPSQPIDPNVERDYETSLQCLCHEYLVFERRFGSDKSLSATSKAIEKKLAKLFPDNNKNQMSIQTSIATKEKESDTQMSVSVRDTVIGDTVERETTNGQKRSIETQTEEAQPSKKAKLADSEELSEANDSVRKGGKDDGTSVVVDAPIDSKPPEVVKVKVGGLEYPAHPFTVRVLDLTEDTEDMDLIDNFRPRCGAIVHARIMREKRSHGKGRSKGWALVQFEERESVEKALCLSDVLVIREKSVKVARSNIPAIGIIPAGFHRVNPKGEGKYSKRNQKMKERKSTEKPISEPAKNSTLKVVAKTDSTSESPSGMGILAFRPRGVQHGNKHRKVKLSLSEKQK